MTFVKLVLIAVLTATGAAAMDTGPSADTLVQELLKKSGGPGAAVIALKDGQIDFATAGLRRRGGAAVTDQDLWHVGSVTKTMTAMVIARLAERGVVSWDDTVGDVLSPVTGPAPPEFTDVSYQDLLDHRSGFISDISHDLEDKLFGERDGRDVMADRITYVSELFKQGPARKTIDGYLYSNGGYITAGAMLEHATGQTWEDLVRQEVFQPLELHSAGFGDPGEGHPNGHVNPTLGWMTAVPHGPYADNPPVFGPAGTVHISPPDLMRYLQVHMDEPTDFLDTESWTRLHVPRPGATYVAGWFVEEKGRLLGAGSNLMWYVDVHVDQNTKSILAQFTNAGRDHWTGRAIDAVTQRFLHP